MIAATLATRPDSTYTSADAPRDRDRRRSARPPRVNPIAYSARPIDRAVQQHRVAPRATSDEQRQLRRDHAAEVSLSEEQERAREIRCS